MATYYKKRPSEAFIMMVAESLNAVRPRPLSLWSAPQDPPHRMEQKSLAFAWSSPVPAFAKASLRPSSIVKDMIAELETC